MVIRTTKTKGGADEEKTCSLVPIMLEGMNERAITGNVSGFLGKLPKVGGFLQKAAARVAVAEPFTAKTFMGFYKSIEESLENYGVLCMGERRFITPVGEITTLAALRDAELRADKIACGSYISFKSNDDTLQGTLYVGHKEDRALAEAKRNAEGGELQLSERVQLAVTKLKRDGAGAAADVAAGVVLRALPVVSILASGDLARRIYNAVTFDSHWTLELLPVEGVRVTDKQFKAYRSINDVYGIK